MDWYQLFNPLLWLGGVLLLIFNLFLIGMGLCILTAFVLFCRQVWLALKEGWNA